MVAAADVGNRAEGTEPVAAFGDLDVRACPVNRAKNPLWDAWRNVALKAQHVIDDAYDPVLVVGIHERRDLGKLLGKRSAIARRYAAAHHNGERVTLPLLLLRELEGGVERLLRRRDEK